jgi:glycerol-3-phosphate dehydrogenase (NAD(P)+)
MKCAVIGAGAWGTALADLLAANGHAVSLWALESDVADDINSNHRNARFLAGASLSEGVVATCRMADALESAQLVTYATPAQNLRAIARCGAEHVRRDATIAVASKGIERETLALMSEVVACEIGGREVVAVSGPSFAAEVAARQPTAIVAASDSSAAAELAQHALSSASFRVYTHDDLIGVELAGALKNVMAVATGIVEGMGLGFNSRAALITRGLAEMTRLGVALGASPSTFAGLAGIGDLVLTCTGALSRNRAVGLEIGRGATLEAALAGKETIAEGVQTTASAVELASREGVEMPIAQTVFRILFEGHPVRQTIGELMARELRPEQDT